MEEETYPSSCHSLHIRHVETPYDRLLTTGMDSHEARAMVEKPVHAVLAEWEGSVP